MRHVSVAAVGPRPDHRPDQPSRDRGSIPLRSSYRLSAPQIVALAMIANVLLFVRIGVLFNPRYSYLAPAGADKVFYYAYTRSLVIDHDFDFNNEMAMRPPTTGLHFLNGRPTNRYPIGSSMMAVPAFAATHLAVVLGNSLGLSHVRADGYSAPYALSYALGEMAWGLFGMYLFYRAASRYFTDQVAALAAVAAWFSTNALHYTAVDLVMSHAAALFSIAWCSYEAVALRESVESRFRWLRLGISSALLILVRYQNGVYLLVPMVAIASCWSVVPSRVLIRNLVVSAAAFLAMFIPQLFAWRAVFGSWLANSYGSELSAFTWMPPFADLLFNPTYGLTVWLPSIAIGLVGCFSLAIARKDVIAAAAGLASIVNICVTGQFWVENIVRSPFDVLFPFCLGFGYIISVTRWRMPKLTLAVILLLIIWNVPFAAITGAPVVGPRGSFFEGWLQCLLLLAHASSVVPGAAS